MDALYNLISFEEQIPLKLRLLFEKYGYSEYKMGKFESYELYQENMNYLKNNSIITFTDSKGRLMALKPDVTMSIVNNIQPDVDIDKLYYIENVFRRNVATGEYQEIKQIGLEYIGTDNGYSEIEVVLLALKSLETISSRFILNLSHMGFMQGLFQQGGIDDKNSEKIVKAVKQKNPHEISRICREAGIDEKTIECIRKTSNLSGSFGEAVKAARKIVSDMGGNESMATAVDELEKIFSVAADMGYAGNIRLDFSVTNDLDYYNGVLLQGYIEEVPASILTGGRYDNLMKKCGKDKPAIGFALNLEGLMRAIHKTKEYKVDVAVVYGNATPEETAKVVNRFVSQNKSVRAVKQYEESIRAKEIYRI